MNTREPAKNFEALIVTADEALSDFIIALAAPPPARRLSDAGLFPASGGLVCQPAICRSADQVRVGH